MAKIKTVCFFAILLAFPGGRFLFANPIQADVDLIGNATTYFGAGMEGRNDTSVLYLSQPVSYFGLWFTAADSQNNFSLYLGEKKIADFSTGGLAVAGLDSGDFFGPADFFALPDTTFDEVFFASGSGTGFQAAHHAASLSIDSLGAAEVQAITSTPEPSTFLLVLAPALLGFLNAFRGHRQSLQ